MKNFLIILVAIILLAALIVYAYVTYDSGEDEVVSVDYTYSDIESPEESTAVTDENAEITSDSTSDTEDSQDRYDFTVENMGGNLVKRSEISGKPMVVHFWASWCGQCIYELPALQATYEKYGDQVEFMIVCITDGVYETVESAKEFLADKGYTFPIYFEFVEVAVLHRL